MSEKRIFTILFFLAIFLFLGWLFIDIVVYFFMALVLSIIGSPIVKLLEKIKIRRWKMPESMAAGITLIALLGVITSLIMLIVPIVSRELVLISSINPELFTNEIETWLSSLEKFMIEYGMLDANEHLSTIIANQFSEVLKSIDIQNIAGNIISFATSMFIAVFAVTFLTFYSLKDKSIFFKTVEKTIPINYRESYHKILNASKPPLIRYFTGVFLEMAIMGLMEGLFCFFMRIPNPFLIGVIGGLLNIIPYLGSIIGVGLSLIMTITTLLPQSPDGALLTSSVVKVMIAFGIAKLVDDFVLQPVIYGKSVKAHPVEIFVVILIAGQIGGIFGMIFAVPAYTLLRIIVKEFFGYYYGVDNSIAEIQKQ
jgi:predicted PurR-regulated permease PerM